MRIEKLGVGEPEIAVVGGIHGDEPCGERAVEELLVDPPEVEEPVLLVIANELALEQGVRYVDEDLNRVFPGEPETDSHERRLAARLSTELEGCRTLSLHSTQSYGRPFALVRGVGTFERSVCPRLTVDAVVDTTATSNGRIFDAIPEVIEVECGYQRSAVAAENAVQLAREFLAATDALDGDFAVDGDADDAEPDPVPLFRLGAAIPKTQAERYEIYAKNFEEVAAGEAFAAADDADVVAEQSFHPVLVSAEGYEDIYGFRAERVGTLP